MQAANSTSSAQVAGSNSVTCCLSRIPIIQTISTSATMLSPLGLTGFSLTLEP